MFTKDELDLLDVALAEYWLKLHEQHQKDLAKGRHKSGRQAHTMQRVLDLQSKIFNMTLNM